MKKFSVVVRVNYIFEVKAKDEAEAEKRARKLYNRGSLRLADSAKIDCVFADEMGPE